FLRFRSTILTASIPCCHLLLTWFENSVQDKTTNVDPQGFFNPVDVPSRLNVRAPLRPDLISLNCACFVLEKPDHLVPHHHCVCFTNESVGDPTLALGITIITVFQHVRGSNAIFKYCLRIGRFPFNLMVGSRPALDSILIASFEFDMMDPDTVMVSI